MESNPTLFRLAVGIPAAGVGGAIGYLTGDKAHKLESAARGAGVGYLTGAGMGIGAELGDRLTDAPNHNLGMLSGGLTGGVLGYGVGRMMQGVPPWEQRKRFREELLTVINLEHDKLRKELQANSPVAALQKIGQTSQDLTEWAEQHPEAAVIPAAGLTGAVLANKRQNPRVNALRGLLIGLATGGGAVGGSHLGRQVDPDSGPVAGGAVGGLLAYLAAAKALPNPNEKQAISPVLQHLLEVKQLSDRKEYHGKYSRLRALIEQYPDDFVIDSQKGNIVGLTHTKTGFKIHAPIKILPTELRRLETVESPTELPSVLAGEKHVNDVVGGGLAVA